MPATRKTDDEQRRGYGFGTFAGVFTPSILTIIGVVMYLRFGWVLGNVGLAKTLVIVTVSSTITFLTGLSISALATNMRMEGGGAYYMLSRSLGLESGAALGIPLALAQAVGVSFYISGFAEALVEGVPALAGVDPRYIGLGTLLIITVVASRSADIAMKAQYFIMGTIALSLVVFFLGGTPSGLVAPDAGTVPANLGFWAVLAVFFPAVTGILSGVGMSGDLKNPSRSIPLGTLAAVLTGYAIYMAVPIVLHAFVGDAAILKTDSMILKKCAVIQWPVMIGILAATISSAIGSLLAAPRVMQALAGDHALPRFIGRGYGTKNDPVVATGIAFAIAGTGIWLGDINAIAPVLTMFNLTTYALLNLSAGLEEMMGNPSWRPTFRVRSFFAFAGFLGCVGMMFMISPGWTFIAIAFEIGVYWLMKRKAVRARWGDMRLGLLMFGARFVIRKLAERPGDGRNWRPILLVFAGSPKKRWHLLEMAAAISLNKSLLTVASVIPEESWTAERADSLRLATRSYLAERGIEAQVRIQPGETSWSGMRELVRAYGWGPIVPNTILLGPPTSDGTPAAYGSLVRLLASRRRNIVIVDDNADAEQPSSRERTIDIWWRGKQANAPFMLALALLLMRSHEWRGARLRICNVAEDESRVDESRHILEGFLAEARVRAETVVLPPRTSLSVMSVIRDTSAKSDLVLMGLRRPVDGETDEAYGDYVRNCILATESLPLVALALAAEDIDFKSIFA